MIKKESTTKKARWMLPDVPHFIISEITFEGETIAKVSRIAIEKLKDDDLAAIADEWKECLLERAKEKRLVVKND